MRKNSQNCLKFIGYSYPINNQYANCVSATEISSSFLVAYASGKNVIVLKEGAFFTAVLSEHNYEVCTVCLAYCSQQIISCDISGEIIFWNLNNSEYFAKTKIKMQTPIISASFIVAKNEIFMVNEMKELIAFETIDGQLTPKILTKGFSFCMLSNDGKYLIAHNFKNSVTIFDLKTEFRVFQIIHLSRHVTSIDVHPYLQILFVLTADNVLRIYQLSEKFTSFVMTSSTFVPFPGFFIRLPDILFQNRKAVFKKNTKIALMNPNTLKIYYIIIDKNGKICNNSKNELFEFNQFSDAENQKHKLLFAFKTNKGTQIIYMSNDSLNIISKEKKWEILFHNYEIIHSELTGCNNLFFTLDKSGKLIVWHLFDFKHDSFVVSNSAVSAAWISDCSLVFYQKDTKQFITFNAVTHEVQNFDFEISGEDLISIFYNNGSLFGLTKSSLISKSLNNNKFDFPNVEGIDIFSFSKEYNSQFLFIFVSNNSLHVYLCPSMTKFNCEINNLGLTIKSIAALSIMSFAILFEDSIHFYSFNGYAFVYSNCYNIHGIKGMYCKNASCYGGNLFCFNANNVYAFSNTKLHLFNSHNSPESIKSICSDLTGNFFIEIYDKYFKVFTPCLSDNNDFIDSFIDENDNSCLYFPIAYSNISQPKIKTIQSTFLHLFEFDLMDLSRNQYEMPQPKQLPAIPNQELEKSSFQILTEKENLFDKDAIINLKQIQKITDIDLFGLRFLYTTLENKKVPSYIALWFSFSKRQPQIIQYLINQIRGHNKNKLELNDISNFLLPFSISSHNLLVNLLTEALIDSWNHFQRIENVILYYAALGQTLTLSKLYRSLGDSSKSDFFKESFKTDNRRKIAIKNAYSSFQKGNFEISSALFILGGEYDIAFNIITNKLNNKILCFLIARLLTNSDYNSDIFKLYILNYFKPHDDILQVLLLNLCNKHDKIPFILEKVFLDQEIKNNISRLGDKRIALFEIYWYINRLLLLTKNQNITNFSIFDCNCNAFFQLIQNLIKDGFAPLANYIIKITEFKNYFGKFVTMELSDQNDDIPDSNIRTELLIEETKPFDFGGCGDWGDDIDADYDYSDNLSENDNDKMNSIPDSQSNNTSIEEIDLSNKSVFQIESNDIWNYYNTFLIELVRGLNTVFYFHFNFYTKKNVLIKSLDTNTPNNNELGLFLLGSFTLKFAYNFLSLQNKEMIKTLYESIIQSAIIFYYYSSFIPMTPKSFLKFIQILYFLSSEEPAIFCEDSNDIKLNYSNIMNMSNKKVISSIMNGAIAFSLWTYNPPLFLFFAYNDSNHCFLSMNEIISSKSQGIGLFDTDFSSTKFPDTVPAIMLLYSDSLSNNYTIERNRILVMFMILNYIIDINNYFENDLLLTYLLSKQKILQKTLKYYQSSFNSLKFKPNDDIFNMMVSSEQNNQSNDEQNMPSMQNLTNFVSLTFKNIIFEMYEKSLYLINTIKYSSLTYTSSKYFSILENNDIYKQNIIDSPYNKISTILLMPLHKGTRGVMLCNNNKLVSVTFSVDYEKDDEIQAKFNEVLEVFDETLSMNNINNYNEKINTLVGHPSFNLFFTVSNNFLNLYNLDQGPSDYQINRSTADKIKCVSFSPNGSALAVCSQTVIDVFRINFASSSSKPIHSKAFPSKLFKINSISWCNDDTKLAICCKSMILIINLSSEYCKQIKINPEWGKATVIQALHKKFLLAGTKTGRIIVFDIDHELVEPLRIFDAGSRITCMYAYEEIVLVGTKEGRLIIICPNDLEFSKKIELNFEIKSISMQNSRIVVVGDSSKILLWNEHSKIADSN